MIPAGVQVFFAVEPVDMRGGFERLSGVVRERIGLEPRCGALFVFVGKRRSTAKIVYCDGTGMCVFSKRLDRGTFELPGPLTSGMTHIEVDELTLDVFLDGVVSHGKRTLRERREGVAHRGERGRVDH